MLLLAKTLEGLEEILAEELAAVGAEKIHISKRAVEFEGDMMCVYKANLQCRCAIRILISIGRFTINNENDLYRAVQSISWDEYLDKDDTIAVDATVHSDYFNHSKFVAYKTKDAIVDQFRDKYGSRPDVDLDDPKLRVNIHIRDRYLSVSLDSSGDSLHRRGYRARAGEAPIS